VFLRIEIEKRGKQFKKVSKKNYYFHSFREYEGTTPVILLADPDLLRKVLIKDSNIFINRRVYIKNFLFCLSIKTSFYKRLLKV
jgi:hypothetical protein